jgi:hypothetical protein
MKQRRQWVGFKIIPAAGKAKPDKIPVVATDPERKASHSRPGTWSTFQEALRGLAKGWYTAVGYALAGDIVGIDLDGERWVVADKEPSGEAQAIIDRCGSFAEWSISGGGIHILLHGKLPGQGRRNNRAGVEIYTIKRFFVVTGRPIDSTPCSINENQAAINWFYSAHFCDRGQLKAKRTPNTNTASAGLPPVAAGGSQSSRTEGTEEDREDGGSREMTSADSGPSVYSVQEVIRRTQPTAIGQRNACIFDLARGLKHNAGMRYATPDELRPWVREWHRIASPVIGTKCFDDTWADFLRAWDAASVPLGLTVDWAWAKATSEPLPAVAQDYDSEQVRLLVELCWHLASLHTERRFFLSSHQAAALLGVRHTKVLKWLNMLCVDGVLQRVESGNERRATRYRFIKIGGKGQRA